MQPLLVIGAGAKAAAIAAKACALRECGYGGPDLVVIEEHELGANWTGRYGYTDGRHRLGTPPEKDVGFPYDDPFVEVAETVLARFSWQSFLANNYLGGSYGDWIDRGRPHPFHHRWAEYIAWVISRAAKHKSGCVSVVTGRATEIRPERNGWSVKVIKSDDSGSKRTYGCGVVVTGPGGPKKSIPAMRSRVGGPALGPAQPGLYNGIDFWTRLPEIKNLQLGKGEELCVIGSGETAASIVVELVTSFPHNPVIVINGHGTIFSRGEGFHENRVFTDAEHEAGVAWATLPAKHRDEIIGRADRGVFSLDTLSVINRADKVRHEAARVAAIVLANEAWVAEGNSPNAFTLFGRTVTVANESGPDEPILEASIVVDATGFDEWWFLGLLPKKTRDILATDAGKSALRRSITEDLSISPTELSSTLSLQPGFLPDGLHLPTLAGWAQGPGFPNLSCLGRLSERILRPYILPDTLPDNQEDAHEVRPRERGGVAGGL